MRNETSELTFGGTPTSARRHLVGAALLLAVAATIMPLAATAAAAAPGPQVCQDLAASPCGTVVVDPGPIGPTDLAPETDAPGEPTPSPTPSPTRAPSPTPALTAAPAEGGVGDGPAGDPAGGGAGGVAGSDSYAGEPVFAPARDALDVGDTTAESDLPVLQIAGLGLLGAVTTTALMITVVRRKLDERYGR